MKDSRLELAIDLLIYCAFLVILILISGCAYLKSNTYRCVETPVSCCGCSTNCVMKITEKTTARGFTLLDANASIVKFHNSANTTSNGVYGPGTYASGVNESSSSTNLAALFQAMMAGAVQGAVQGTAAAMKP